MMSPQSKQKTKGKIQPRQKSLGIQAFTLLFLLPVVSFTGNAAWLMFNSALPVAAQSPTPRRSEAIRLNNQGLELLNTGSPLAALEKFQQALTIIREIRERRDEGSILSNIGEAYRSLGQYPKALDYYQQALKIAQEFSDRQGEGITLNNIGLTYVALGQSSQALNYYQQALSIHRQVKNRISEGGTLTNIGNVYRDFGQYQKALEYYQQALTIHREVKQVRFEGITLNSIGNVYALLGQYSKALEYYEQALIIQRQVKDLAAEGATLSNIGFVHSRLGQYPKALNYYQQALAIHRRVMNRQGEGSTLSNIGGIYNKLGQQPKALDYYQQALAIRREIKDRFGEGITLNNIGLMYYSLAQYPKALEFYEQALIIQRQVKNRPDEGTTLYNLGLVYAAQGQYSKALEYYQQALAISREVKDRPGEGSTLSAIGSTYKNLGQYPKALESLQQALTIRREIKDRPGEGITLNDIGLTYSDLGQYPKALESLQQALTIRREIKDRPGEGISLGSIGTIYRFWGQYSKALTFYQQALKINREVQDLKNEGTALHNIADSYSQLGQYTEALENYQQALTISRKINNRPSEAITLNNMGEVYRSLGQYPKALEAYQQSLTIAREVKNRPSEATTLNNMGGALLALGKAAAAEKPLLDAITIWESLRPGLTDENKVSLFETQAFTYRFLQQSLIAQNKPETALEIAERGRARAFAELLAKKLSNQQPAGKQQNSNQSAIELPNIQQIKQIAKSHNAVLVEYSVIQDEFEVQGKKRWQDSTLYIWIIQPGGSVAFRQVDLKPILHPQKLSLQQYIQQVRYDALGVRGLGIKPNNNARQPTTQLKALHQLLIQPIQDLLPKDPNQPVIFIPQSALFLVPFAALQDSDNQYLIEQHTILTMPSIQVLELTQKVRSGQRGVRSGNSDSLLLTPDSSLIVGNPTMPKVLLVPGEPAEQLPSLPGAEREAKAIAEFLKAPVLTGAQATKAKVLQQISQARLVHLATHGLLDEQNGIRSAIALAPSGSDDGLLTADEILNLRLQAELVVLSACDTGRGKITGDGVIGLSRSLITAGVPSVLVSLWSVPDAPTAELMTEFYRQLKQNPDKAQALRQAMLATKAKHPNPRDWAAFTLIGEAQ